MKKIDMYEEVPERFHKRVCDTLEQLEDTTVVRFPMKKYAIVCAVAVFLLSSISVTALELYKWHKTASERFDTEKELEDKLTAQGSVLPGGDTDIAENIEIVALQSIKKNDGFYFLAGFKWPTELEWNEDIMFEKSTILSDKEFLGCSVNFAGAPDENGMVYVEAEVLGNAEMDYFGEIELVLTNLVQTKKSAVTDTLVEADWKLTFSLPTGVDVKSFETDQKLSVSGHKLEIDRVEIGNFSIKLYTEEEMAMHAAFYSDIQLMGVEYSDGSRKEETGTWLKQCSARDASGEFYFNIPIENAIDTDKIVGLVFYEGGNTQTLFLGENQLTQKAEQTMEASSEEDNGHLFEIAKDKEISDFQVLYVKYDNAILADGENVYLWDTKCDSAVILMQLKEYGYDRKLGGEIVVQPGGATIVMKPKSSSETVYFWKLGYTEVLEKDASEFWTKEGYNADNCAYELYSADGSVATMGIKEK